MAPSDLESSRAYRVLLAPGLTYCNCIQFGVGLPGVRA